MPQSGNRGKKQLPQNHCSPLTALSFTKSSYLLIFQKSKVRTGSPHQSLLSGIFLTFLPFPVQPYIYYIINGRRVFHFFISLFIYLYVGKKGKKVRTEAANPVAMRVPGFHFFLPCSYLFLQGKNFLGCRSAQRREPLRGYPAPAPGSLPTALLFKPQGSFFVQGLCYNKTAIGKLIKIQLGVRVFTYVLTLVWEEI